MVSRKFSAFSILPNSSKFSKKSSLTHHFNKLLFSSFLHHMITDFFLSNR
jgi:hypothetical protein